MDTVTDPQDNPDQDGRGDKSVPLAALQAETRKRQSLETQLAELRGRVEGMTAAASRPPDAKPKPMSRAELNKAVEDEKITQDEADALWEKQIVERATKEASAAAAATISTTGRAQRIAAELARYKAAVPDVADKESATFAKVAGEYRFLVGEVGDPEDMATELKAVRAALGPIDALEATLSPRERESHAETGGRGADGGGERADGWPKDMPAARRRYYDDQINRGVYTKESAIAEFRYKPKHRPDRGRAA